MNLETDTPEEVGKKLKERSAAYPNQTIEQSLSFVSNFYKNFRNNPAKRDDILVVMESTISRDLACACYYSFLSRDKDCYQVTDLFKTISNHITEKEKTQSLLTAFESPKLYKELIEKFDWDELPQNLAAHLIRFHRITEAAAPDAANTFIENAKYVGVLGENNVLIYKIILSRLNDPNTVFVKKTTDNISNIKEESETEKITTNPNLATVTSHVPFTAPEKPQLLLNEINAEEKLIIKLSEKKIAYLLYPSGLNEKDIKILKMQIDALELTL